MHYYTKLPEAYSLVRPIVDVLPAIPVECQLNKLLLLVYDTFCKATIGNLIIHYFLRIKIDYK